MWHKRTRRAPGFDFPLSATKSQRLSLGKHIRKENVVVTAQRCERAPKPDEVTRNQARSLVNQLVEGMLAVGPRFAPVDRACLVIHLPAIQRDVLTVALHRQLLQIRGKAFQVLFVGQDRHRLRA